MHIRLIRILYVYKTTKQDLSILLYTTSSLSIWIATKKPDDEFNYNLWYKLQIHRQILWCIYKLYYKSMFTYITHKKL